MKKKIDAAKRIKGILGTTCLLFIFLTGCGNKDAITTNTVSIGKGGIITQTIVEDFPMDTYDIEELKQMNEEEVNEYNTQTGAENISIKKTETDGSKVTVVMEYESANAYYEFNHKDLYVGTVEQAKTAGYDMNTPLKDIKTGKALTKEEVDVIGEKHIVIVTEPIDVKTFGTVLYISDGVTYKNKKLVTVSGEHTAYIVFK